MLYLTLSFSHKELEEESAEKPVAKEEQGVFLRSEGFESTK